MHKVNLVVCVTSAGYYLNVNSIELGQVRLAFQAFLPDEHGKYTRIVQPKYSHVIYDKSKYPAQVPVRQL